MAVHFVSASLHHSLYTLQLTRYDQEVDDNKRKYTMSWWADCSKLKSPYEGPVRLEVEPGANTADIYTHSTILIAYIGQLF